MMALTRKVDYAMVALARLAERQARGGGPVSTRQLAEQDGLPLPLLTKAMKDLQRGGIITSVRGAQGGYYLRESPAWISLADVIDRLEGPVKVVPCCEENEEDACLACHVITKCPISLRMRRLNDRITTLLRQITLKDLMSSQEIDVPLLPVQVQSRSPT